MNFFMKTLIDLAWAEDVGTGDITSAAIFREEGPVAIARIIAKERGILSGLEFALAVFRDSGGDLEVTVHYSDGDALVCGDTVFTIRGSVASILKAERVALNALQFLSGIATVTRAFVDRVTGTRAMILDTRKTLPGWRSLSKKAVRDGGGHNHRMGLYDQFLIKENHIAACGGIAAAIAACRKYNAATLLEVEVRNLEELREALAVRPDMILLDNFDIETLREAVSLARGQCPLEASGGVSLETVQAIAQTGVDRISIGALTHSPKAFDFSLLICSPL